ncbi:hypothetical protein M0R36_10435 [bacterium]|jgi:RecA/RadA recombinase|nr:hypothetical protein [bacterium]
MSEKSVLKNVQEMYDNFIEKEVDDLVTANDQKQTIPTGIQLLDLFLGGGMVVGGLSCVAGRPGCGKTTLAGNVIGNAQKVYEGKVLGLYLDSENAMSTFRLAQLGVVNPKIKVREAKTVEQVFKIIDTTCRFLDENKDKFNDFKTVIIWDSIANTKTEKDSESDNINDTIGLRARLLSALLPKYLDKLEKYNISLIAINQFRDKIQMGLFKQPSDLRYLSGEKMLPGGNALQYNISQLIELRESAILEEKQYGFNGIVVRAKCIKSRLFAPNIEFEMILDYNSGFDNFWTNYNLLRAEKRMTSGRWSKLTNQPEATWNGTRGAYLKYIEDAEFKKMWDKEVSDIISELSTRYRPLPGEVNKNMNIVEENIDSGNDVVDLN